MLPRLLAELARLLRWALEDNGRTYRLCVFVVVLAVASGAYGWVKP